MNELGRRFDRDCRFIHIRCAICESVELGKEGVIRRLPKSTCKRALNISPLLIRAIQNPTPSLCEPCCTETTSYCVRRSDPAVTNHGRERAVE
jgi:hypothetical protein